MLVDKVSDYRTQFSKWWTAEWKTITFPEKVTLSSAQSLWSIFKRQNSTACIKIQRSKPVVHLQKAEQHDLHKIKRDSNHKEWAFLFAATQPTSVNVARKASEHLAMHLVAASV